MSSTNQPEDKWNAYLQARPKFMEWFIDRMEWHMHGMEEESEELDVLLNLSPAKALIRATSSNKVAQFVEESATLSRLYRRVAADDKKVLQYDDGEAMAAATLNVDYIKSVLEGLVNSDRPCHLRLNFAEASYASYNYNYDDVYLYLCLLCARVDKDDPDSIKTRVHARHGQSIIKRRSHPLWDTVNTFVDTICKYDNVVMLGIVGGKDLVIDENYLNNILISDREPNDVGGNVWHDMSVRFVNRMNEEYQKAMDKSMTTIGISPNTEFYSLMIRVLPSFLTDNADDVVFLNSVHDYIMKSKIGLFEYRPGFLKPDLLDMLRAYGASFVDPLFMRMAEDMMNSGSDSQQ